MPAGLIVMYPNAVDDVYGGENAGALARRVKLLAPALSAESLAAQPDLLAQADVIFSGWGAPLMDAAFLERAPRLRAVFYAAGTIRSWVTDTFWRRGIVVTTAAEANAIPVADYTAATIAFSLKQGWRYALGAMRLGRHPERVIPAGGFRSTLGLVSFGAVARLVRERFANSDLNVIAYDPFIPPGRAAAAGIRLVSLDTLFRESDVVSVHAPLLPATRRLIGRALLSQMKSGATFINTARGELVREDELAEVFSQREDLTAVLDVTHPEPPVEGSPLYSLPNVVLTPHIAGSLGRECRRLGQAMIDEFDRWHAGQPLRWQITEAQAALTA
jgi:phosphoglycerate dehydrogenase-like enzyme